MGRPIIVSPHDVREICHRMAADELLARTLAGPCADDAQGLRARNRGRSEALVTLIGWTSGARTAMMVYLSTALRDADVPSAATMADHLVRLRGES